MGAQDAQYRPQGLDDYVASYAHITHAGIYVDKDPSTTTRGPITDPEGRHAPTMLAPWTDGSDVLDDIFSCIRSTVEEYGNPEVDSPRARFPSRDHVGETGSELPAINCEAAVHFFDYDTIYKPAKRIIDSALARSVDLCRSISICLKYRHYGTRTGISTTRTGKVVFSPHSRTISVPPQMIGQKRKRSRSASQPLASSSELEEHVSTEDDDVEEIMDEAQVLVGQPSPDHGDTPGRAIKVKSGPGDFYCSFVMDKNSKDTKSKAPRPHLLLVGEAKAPHKLTRDLIERAIGEKNTIDLRQFIQSLPSSADVNAGGSGGSTNYDANQRWLAAVATQIYSVLVRSELRYGYITTGESYILVRIRPGEATTLEYLLLTALRSQSPREVERREAAWLDWLAATPLARMSSLALLSLFGDGELTKDEIAQTKAAKPAMIWKSPQHREQSLESGSFESTASAQTRGSDPDYTEEGEQSRKRACDVGNADEGESDSEHQHKRACISDTDNEQQYPKAIARSIPPLSTLFRTLSERYADPDLSMDEVPFCSSRCLRSLTSDETTDPLCPNSAIHAQTHQRPTSAAELRTLARTCVVLPSYRQTEQETEDQPVVLEEDAKNAIYMHSYGASSALFKVRVGGYVLAAKAARAVHPMMEREVLQRLRLEATLYKRLNTMQGHGVPVCLGLVGVSSPQSSHADHYGYIDDIVQFPAVLLLSWAGSALYDTPVKADVEQERTWQARIRADVDRLLSQIHGFGILHGDAELRNIVVVGGRGDSPTVSFVDFERAVTKGRLARRLARDCKGMDEKDVEQRFQQACEREKEHCLGVLDAWAKRRIERMKLLAEPSHFPQLLEGIKSKIKVCLAANILSLDGC